MRVIGGAALALSLGAACATREPQAPAIARGPAAAIGTNADAGAPAAAAAKPEDAGADAIANEAPPGYHMDFSDAERFAKHFDDHERDAWQKPKEVMRLLELSRGQNVADLGAGTGYFESYLSEAVGEQGRVLALDAERGMIDYLEHRGKASGWSNVSARLVPVDDPRLEPASCDRILIVDTWHHIDDRERYAKKLAQGLKPHGLLLIVDFTLDSDFGPPQRYRIPPEQARAELLAGGLDAEVVSESLPKQYAVRATRR